MNIDASSSSSFSLLLTHHLHGDPKMNTTYSTALFILSLLLHLSLSSSSDPFFNTCFPEKCGGLNITYPFYIVNLQHSYCGYPGFEVSCKNGSTPYLNNISGSSYVIKNIWYENQTFEVVDSVFLSSDCSGSIRNLTLGHSPFKFATKNLDLTLLMNCPDKVLEKYGPEKVICRGLSVQLDDPEFESLRGQCGGEVVSVPYKEEIGSSAGGSGGFSLREVASRGASLRWVANNCSACTATGGQCGFIQNISLFQCYCSDRPHSHQCHKRCHLLYCQTQEEQEQVLELSKLPPRQSISI